MPTCLLVTKDQKFSLIEMPEYRPEIRMPIHQPMVATYQVIDSCISADYRRFFTRTFRRHPMILYWYDEI